MTGDPDDLIVGMLTMLTAGMTRIVLLTQRFSVRRLLLSDLPIGFEISDRVL